jgi:hypothetical protein
MGVPGFFLWLMKKYKKEGFVFQKEKQPDKIKFNSENLMGHEFKVVKY